MIKYELPNLKDENELKEYLQECFQSGEHDVIICQDLLLESFEKWVILMQRNADSGNGDWGRSLTLLCHDDSDLVGILCVRYELTHELEAMYGNIGYHVRPSKRRNGYATQMLQYALKICEEKGLEKVVLGCHSDNLASVSVIEKCGGMFVDIVKESSGITNHYYEIRERSRRR